MKRINVIFHKTQEVETLFPGKNVTVLYRGEAEFLMDDTETQEWTCRIVMAELSVIPGVWENLPVPEDQSILGLARKSSRDMKEFLAKMRNEARAQYEKNKKSEIAN